jgi:tRNA pseudouridine38-40 synthase
MAQNFKLIIEYDGSAYHGWQRQKADRSVQGEIERAIEKMTGRPVTLFGSGRTDAGVHALGQVANFLCDTRLTGSELQKGLNSLLPDDIVIRDCAPVAAKFHARYDVTAKTYHYRILNRPLPAAVGRQYLWHIRNPLAIGPMRSAAAVLLGTHDFKSFEGAGSPRSHTVRTVIRAEFRKAPDGHLFFEIEADGFLRYMVRNLVGTLVEVGRGKFGPADVEKILLSKNRDLAGPTAPARGLFLVRVRYDNDNLSQNHI